tara:strand:- start:153 stop:746 length:594 start_codon:yes stop_codon:yes gene_type:complete
MKFELLYPIFLLCLEFIDDNYWKIIYEDLSYGKCPYGIYIKNNYICSNFKNKQFSYKITSHQDPELFFNDTYDLLKNKFGLSSKNDKIDNKLAFEISESQLFKDTCCNWNSIKRKNIKLLFIEKFIIEKSQQYNLSLDVSKKLLDKLYLGLLLKSINKNHIIFDNFKIKDITCLTFSNKNFDLDLDIYQCKQRFIFI